MDRAASPIIVSAPPRECAICAEIKDASLFPTCPLTKLCSNAETTCLQCVSHSIRSDLEKKHWKEIACPECGATLEHDVVRQFADLGTRRRYEDLLSYQAIQEHQNFIWVSHLRCLDIHFRPNFPASVLTVFVILSAPRAVEAAKFMTVALTSLS